MGESYTPLSDPLFQACLDQQQLLLWKERGIIIIIIYSENNYYSENWIQIYVPSPGALSVLSDYCLKEIETVHLWMETTASTFSDFQNCSSLFHA